MDDKKSNVTNSGTSNGADFIVKKDLVQVTKTQDKFNQFMKKFKLFSLTSSEHSEDALANMNDKIASKTFSYINKMKSTTGDDITRFLNKTLQTSNSTNSIGMMGINSTDALLNNESNNFSAFFFDRYKNINNTYEDLRVITEYLFELQEAVTTMRDNIINSDDLVSTISRKIIFDNNHPYNEDKNTKNNMTTLIEKMEKKYKILERLKNIIIPGVLTYGDFFVYTIPYADAFDQFEKRKNANGQQQGITKEGFIHPTIESFIQEETPKQTFFPQKNKSKSYTEEFEVLTEKVNEVFYDKTNLSAKKYSVNEIANEINGILEGIEICDSDQIPFLEDGNLSILSDDEVRNEALKAYRKVSSPQMSKPFWTTGDVQPNSGVVDTDISKSQYKDIPDSFIKLYPPERVIPVYVMDTVIGYYVLYDSFGEVRNSILLNSSLNRTNLAYSQTHKKELDDSVISIIATAICDSIDKKYVASNPKFKELMVNAIAYNDFYKKKFKVQFIPESYMTHFKINEDPETHMGVSVLKKSMFYGKLYLCLLLFKIITILTKSNDMRIYYIKNAGINKNLVNRIQNIARDIKEKQISFNDLASVNTVLAKTGKYGEAFIPMGKSGEKNIEFDILSGQDVQLNTDLMEMLRKGMVNNTGVPSVILSYMEEADFSRTLVMQHSKYMARIISLQTELEVYISEWYKKILLNEKIINQDVVDQFKFEFTRPKSLNTQDMTELISNAETLSDFMTKMMVDENDAETTAAFKRSLIKENLLSGVFNWKDLESLLTKVQHEMKLEKTNKDLSGGGEGM